MQIGGLGVHLRLTQRADNNVAEQRHPSPGLEHIMRSAPADRRVDPVPRRRGHEDIEAPAAGDLAILSVPPGARYQGATGAHRLTSKDFPQLARDGVRVPVKHGFKITSLAWG
jgi:hypothetical protein